MRLRKLGERELLALIRRHFSAKRNDVHLGIGDDTAVVMPGSGKLLVTKDLLVEDCDFLLSRQDPRFLGRKSLNVNLSDIAAMGGTPLYAVLGLGLPGDISLDWVIEFFSGIKDAARDSGTALIGGDLSHCRKVFVSITLIGRAGGNIISRSGARPGDRIFVSGHLGDAKQGFLLYKKGCLLGEDPASDALLKAFLDPKPCLRLGRELAARRAASAMIDCSDGLSVDLNHICESSGVGAEIDLTKLPLSPALRKTKKNPLPLALHGGEDFELIFTVKASALPAVAKIGKKFKVTEIGKITHEKGMICAVNAQGRRSQLEIKGYEHFK